MNQLALFDYSALDTSTRIFVEERTTEIKSLIKRSAQDIIEIGGKLTEVKERLGHGRFGAWLAAEFEWTQQTAVTFMRVHGKFKNFLNLEGFAPSALYLFASPSTPEEAVQEAIDRAQDGERITHTIAKEIVAQYKEPVFVPTQEWKELSPVVASQDTATDDGGNEDDEIERTWRFDPYTQAAYCKYCYDTHSDWEISGNHLEQVWFCERCEHYSADALLDITDLEPERALPHVAHNSGNNEWYTPPEYIKAAHSTLGAIDLDPSSCYEANMVVCADAYYTIDDDGLAQSWQGKVWMNPPYASDLVGKFIDKLILHYRAQDVPEAIVLVNNATETQWFQALAFHATAICFPQRRVRFWSPDGGIGQPLQGQAVLYLGSNPDNFIANFDDFGLLVKVA